MLQVVNEIGTTIGQIEKIKAHENGGVLHRAVSVMLYDQDRRLLLQRRSPKKYHFANLWANSCCSHPMNEETPLDAAQRAMRNELGVSALVCEIGDLIYEAQDPASGLTEREFDHVFIGNLYEVVEPNPEDICEVRWISMSELKEELRGRTDAFVPWLPHIVDLLDESKMKQSST